MVDLIFFLFILLVPITVLGIVYMDKEIDTEDNNNEDIEMIEKKEQKDPTELLGDILFHL